MSKRCYPSFRPLRPKFPHSSADSFLNGHLNVFSVQKACLITAINMSADLFAEFNSPPSGQPQQQQQQQQPQHTSFQANNSGVQQDPFGFLQSKSKTSPPPPQQLSQPWPGLQGQPSGTSNWGASSGFGGVQSPAPATIDDDDDWGDFETVGETNKPDQPSQISWQTQGQSGSWSKPAEQDPWPAFDQKPATIPAHPDPWSMFEQESSSQSKPQPKSLAAVKNPEPGRLVRASTLDIMTNNLVNTSRSSKPSSPTKHDLPPYEEPRPRLKEPTNPNIMFDAAEFELEGGDEDDGFDDDEFGDFESVAPSKPQHTPASKTSAPAPVPAPRPSHPPPSIDLLSLDDPAPLPSQAQEIMPKPDTNTSKPHGFGATNLRQAKQGPGHSEGSSISKAPKPSRPAVTEDEEWGAWGDFESKPAKKATKPHSPAPVDNWDWEPAEPASTAKQEVKEDEPPPINVPPPSVLLSAFPSLFSTGNALFKPVSAQTPSIKERILADPKAVDFLQGYILVATTAGRVVAGRKHRWHRDKILAKSMSISAAGSKGMKLAGVDKTQSKREDREAADVAIAWGDYVGRLRSAVAAAKSAGKASLKVPEIHETMQVQTAKGAPTAPKPCIICGLKREERVSKVDFDVEDSFGEWWVDHWGHRACKNFWQQHEKTLRQR